MDSIKQSQGNDKTLKAKSEVNNIKSNNNLGHINSHKEADKKLRGLTESIGNSNRKSATFPTNAVATATGKIKQGVNKGTDTMKDAVSTNQDETAEVQAVNDFDSYIAGVAGTAAHTTYRMGRRPVNKTVRAVKGYKRQKESAIRKKVAVNNLKTKTQMAKSTIKTQYKAQKIIKEAHIATAKTRQEAVKYAAQASKNTIKVTYESAKVVGKALIEVVRETARFVASAVSELAALFSVAGAIVAIIVVFIFGAVTLIASPYGILFTDSADGGISITDAMSTIDGEFSDNIKKIEKDNPHDKEIFSNSGCGYSIANWSDIVAVWDINLNLGDKQEEVVTIDDGKLDELRNVVNDMVDISHRIDTETTTTLTYDLNGNQLFNVDGTPVVITTVVKTLVIDVEYKSADDMSSSYSFSKSQNSAMLELLSSDDYIALFNNGGVNIDFSTLTFDDETVNDTQKNLVATALNASKYGITAEKGMCQNWVSRVYQVALNQTRKSATNATEAGKKWGVSSDWSKIQVGACVYGYSSSAAGHVGIYIGNGKVIHNLSGNVKIDTLEKWVKSYNGFTWGWNGGDNLTGDKKWNVK